VLCCRVKNWALKFGVDLWEFGRQFTKMSEIQKVSNVTVTLHRCGDTCLALYLSGKRKARERGNHIWLYCLLPNPRPLSVPKYLHISFDTTPIMASVFSKQIYFQEPTAWSCRSSGGQSPASHRGGPVSIPGQVMWDLWRIERQWGRFSPSTSVSLATHSFN
jgi:hypothetical protein